MTEEEERVGRAKYDEVIRRQTCHDCGALRPLKGYGVHRCPRRWHARLERFLTWVDRRWPMKHAERLEAMKRLLEERIAARDGVQGGRLGVAHWDRSARFDR